MPLFNDVSSQIITSATEPTNKYSGLIWNEVNSSGNLLETWTYLNNQWVTDFRINDLSFILGAGTSIYTFSLESAYNIFFRSWTVYWQSDTLTNASNYFAVQFRVYNGLTEILNNPSSIPSIKFDNNLANTPALVNSIIDKVYTTANMYRIILSRNNNPGSNIIMGVKIKYQLIRK